MRTRVDAAHAWLINHTRKRRLTQNLQPRSALSPDAPSRTFPQRSGEVEAIEVHYFGPRRREVFHKLQKCHARLIPHRWAVLRPSWRGSQVDGQLANLPTCIRTEEAMIKSELTQRISSQNPHLYQQDIEKIVTTILDEIIEALRRGDRVELRGFGAFSAKLRGARQGRNPRTGVAVSVAQKAVPLFKTGKEMRARLNPETGPIVASADQVAKEANLNGERAEPQ